MVGNERINFMLKRIVSGGQTGVDRAALDAALEHNLPCGGWCPKGRKAEDGPIPAHYPLQETKSSDYRVRTEQNLKEVDGTLILTRGKPTGGTALTIKLAHKHGKPCLVLDLGQMEQGPVAVIQAWIKGNAIKALNVAGPRESKLPGIHKAAKDVLSGLIGEDHGQRTNSHSEI
jgi:predicted Rossmann-fold nucleotide-binding protein